MPHRALLLSLCLLLSACATAPAAVDPALHGDAARPAAAQAWIRSELYFSVGTEGQAQTRIDEAQWRAFLDREVTPRFPDGLSVLDVHGQYRNRQGAIGRERAKLLVIVVFDAPAHAARVQAIVDAYIRRHKQESVLRVERPVCAGL